MRLRTCGTSKNTLGGAEEELNSLETERTFHGSSSVVFIYCLNLMHRVRLA